MARSDFLIVVLSGNWLSSDWCRSELEWFHRRWAHEGELGVRKRILLVNKRYVDPSARPDLLQGQQGHDFFTFDKEEHEGAREQPYFDVGKIKDDGFVQQVAELANKLRRLVTEILASAVGSDNSPQTLGRPPVPTKGRTVFVARPADDMRQSHARLLNELKSRGFAVVPEADIPSDRSAVAFVDAALASAEVSIHLLGEKRGYAPAEEDPIVRLQLACAASHARVPDPEREQKGLPPFRRIVWAPKIVEDPDQPQPAQAAERDPLAVLDRFGELIDGDKVESDDLSRFVDFLIQYLYKTEPRRPALAVQPGPGTQIYLEHDENDIGYAVDLAEALQKRSITPIFPVLQGPRARCTALNRNKMQTCDAVALCWGSASEVWAMSRLDQWRRLGRKEPFACALLAAPPRDKLKERRIRVWPPEVDVVLDLTNRESPSPEDFDPWLGPR